MTETQPRWWVSTSVVVAVAILVVVIWQAVVVVMDLPKILLPSPVQVAQAAVREGALLAKASLATGMTATVSLLVALVVGGALAVLFSQSRLLRRALFPYVVFLQTVPIVAIAPLLIIWSGYTFRTAVIATVIICLFPVVNNTTIGLLSVRRDHDDLFRMYGVSRWRRLISLQLPTAVTQTMVGLRVSSGLAVIGAIVAEFFVSNGTTYDGLGALMTAWQAQSKTDALMAALIVSALLGLVLFGLVQFCSEVVLRRWTR